MMADDSSFIPPYSTSYAQRHFKIQAARAKSASVLQRDVINSRSSNSSGSFKVSCADAGKLHHSQRVFGIVRPTTIGRNATDHIVRHHRRQSSGSSNGRSRDPVAVKNAACAFALQQKQIALTKRQLYDQASASHSFLHTNSTSNTWVPNSASGKGGLKSAHASVNTHGVAQGILHRAARRTSWPGQRSPGPRSPAAAAKSNVQEWEPVLASSGQHTFTGLAQSPESSPRNNFPEHSPPHTHSVSFQNSNNTFSTPPVSHPTYRLVGSSLRSPNGKEFPVENLSTLTSSLTASPRYIGSPREVGKSVDARGHTRLHNIVNVTVVHLDNDMVSREWSPSKKGKTEHGIVILPFGTSTADLTLALERQFDCENREEYVSDVTITMPHGNTQSLSRGTLGDTPELSDDCTIIGYVNKRIVTTQQENEKFSIVPISPVWCPTKPLNPPQESKTMAPPSTLGHSNSVESLPKHGGLNISAHRAHGNTSTNHLVEPLLHPLNISGSSPSSNAVAKGSPCVNFEVPVRSSWDSTGDNPLMSLHKGVRTSNLSSYYSCLLHSTLSEQSLAGSEFAEEPSMPPPLPEWEASCPAEEVNLSAASLLKSPLQDRKQFQDLPLREAKSVNSTSFLNPLGGNESSGYEVSSPLLTNPSPGSVSRFDMSTVTQGQSLFTAQQRIMLEQRIPDDHPDLVVHPEEQQGKVYPASSPHPNRHLQVNRRFISKTNNATKEIDITDALCSVSSNKSSVRDGNEIVEIVSIGSTRSSLSSSSDAVVFNEDSNSEHTESLFHHDGYVQLADTFLTVPISPESIYGDADFDGESGIYSLPNAQSDDESTDHGFVDEVFQTTERPPVEHHEHQEKDVQPMVSLPRKPRGPRVVELDISALLL